MRRLELTCGMLVGLLVLAGCATAQGTRAPTPAPTTATAMPTSTPVPTPPPLTTFLSPPPQRCPASPPLHEMGGFSGASPVWAGASTDVWHMEQDAPAPVPYPATKILWEVGPNYAQPVTVVVTNLTSGERAWWGNNVATESQQLIIDPTGQGPGFADYHISPGPGWPVPGWREYGSLIFILEAGCYSMQVAWHGGSWQMTFAAGR